MNGRGKHQVMWTLVCILTFVVFFCGSILFKVTYTPKWSKKFSVDWNASTGTIQKDISYGALESNKFDLYLPADHSKDSYGLVVYLHAGGFTSGDKQDDASMLEWLCSKGYVACGINYTLRNAENSASIYTQSMEIKSAIPFVIEEAEKRGYPITEMAMAGGSAGGCLAMLYAYRDAPEAPVPVRMLFEMVGPSSFFAEDWGIYRLDRSPEAAASLFGTMSGVELTENMIQSGEYVELLKPISAFMWVNEDTCPSVLLYGTLDKVQPWNGVRHLTAALQANDVDFQLFEAPHSGHGVQNDDRVFEAYMDTVVEYLDRYMPVH